MVDTHCHLDEFDQIEPILGKMKDGIVIVSGVDQKTNEFVMDLIEKYDNIYGTIGIHPSEVEKSHIRDLEYIEKKLSHPKIVGIGEVGLDYHYEPFNKKLQMEYFNKQIELGKKYRKTVVIHSREAAEDTYNILKQANTEDLKIVLHCYSYSKEMAHRFLEFNTRFGIGGVLTFKNSIKLKEVVDDIGIEYFVLETDSPYLAPEPFRGQKNEPYNIIYVAEKIGQIKGLPLETVLKKTTENAVHQFDLPSNL